MIDLFIDGVRQKSSQNETRNVIHPANGKVVEVAQEASPVDVEYAIKAARKAFDQGPVSKAKRADLIAISTSPLVAS